MSLYVLPFRPVSPCPWLCHPLFFTSFGHSDCLCLCVFPCALAYLGAFLSFSLSVFLLMYLCLPPSQAARLLCLQLSPCQCIPRCLLYQFTASCSCVSSLSLMPSGCHHARRSGTVRQYRSGRELASCDPCPAGSFCPTPGLLKAAGNCLRGFYCPEGSKVSALQSGGPGTCAQQRGFPNLRCGLLLLPCHSLTCLRVCVHLSTCLSPSLLYQYIAPIHACL